MCTASSPSKHISEGKLLSMSAVAGKLLYVLVVLGVPSCKSGGLFDARHNLASEVPSRGGTNACGVPASHWMPLRGFWVSSGREVELRSSLSFCVMPQCSKADAAPTPTKGGGCFDVFRTLLCLGGGWTTTCVGNVASI